MASKAVILVIAVLVILGVLIATLEQFRPSRTQDPQEPQDQERPLPSVSWCLIESFSGSGRVQDFLGLDMRPWFEVRSDKFKVNWDVSAEGRPGPGFLEYWDFQFSVIAEKPTGRGALTEPVDVARIDLTSQDSSFYNAKNGELEVRVPEWAVDQPYFRIWAWYHVDEWTITIEEPRPASSC